MPRDTRLIMWPEQMSYKPFLGSWNNIKQDNILDLSKCVGVHSCGLVASLLKIYHFFESKRSKKKESIKNKPQITIEDYLNKLKNNKDDYGIKDSQLSPIDMIVENKNKEIMLTFEQLGFFKEIKTLIKTDLHEKYCSDVEFRPIITNYFSQNTISYPIYKFNFNSEKDNRRVPLKKFLVTFNHIFKSLSKDFRINKDQLIPIIYEIAKNTADHTESNAYMGCDIIVLKDRAKIIILIGDLGPGIYFKIRDFLINFNPTRKGKIGFNEAYRFALKKGFSTKNNKDNLGMGIPFIVNNSKALKIKLSVIDITTRLVLSSLNPIINKEPPFNEIERSSMSMIGKLPLFYYLQYEVIKK